MITGLFLVICSISEGCSHIPAEASPCEASADRLGLLFPSLQLLTNLVSISSGLSPACYVFLTMTSPKLWLKSPQGPAEQRYGHPTSTQPHCEGSQALLSTPLAQTNAFTPAGMGPELRGCPGTGSHHLSGDCKRRLRGAGEGGQLGGSRSQQGLELSCSSLILPILCSTRFQKGKSQIFSLSGTLQGTKVSLCKRKAGEVGWVWFFFDVSASIAKVGRAVVV